ncbi:hypothetical protein N2152v2_004774 [Parachlorella kessleri]
MMPDFQPSATLNSLSVYLLCAGLGSGLLIITKALRKSRNTGGTLDQVVKPGVQEPEQALLNSKGVSERPNEAASLKPLQHPAALPLIRTSAVTPFMGHKGGDGTPFMSPETCKGGGDDNDSPPDSPTEVLHWHRPSRACSLPVNCPALTQCFAEVLASERAARVAAGAIATVAGSTEGREMEELRQQLVDAQNMVASLRVVNKELHTEVDKLQSQIPSTEVAYEQLKGSFFKLQGRYRGAQARLGAALNEVACLRSELGGGQPRLCSTL